MTQAPVRTSLDISASQEMLDSMRWDLDSETRCELSWCGKWTKLRLTTLGHEFRICSHHGAGTVKAMVATREAAK